MIQLTDIHSLTDFQRNVKAHLKQMKKTGRPRILTVNGKAELVVHDAGSYQKLLELLDQVEAIEGIRHGLDDVQHGRTRPFDEVLENLRRKYELQS